jgi:hypothetical protein
MVEQAARPTPLPVSAAVFMIVAVSAAMLVAKIAVFEGSAAKGAAAVVVV